ncbi:trafficking protein particle complex subunit 6B [Pelomyxa schiedti]|nr:trafficking protein particle complex subunit 6B [Pelomyxa schiedti]
MATAKWGNGSVFEYLCTEMVAYAVRTAGAHPEVGSPVQRLDAMGFSVGEKIVERITREKSRFHNNAELLKFITKEFWTATFRKEAEFSPSGAHWVITDSSLLKHMSFMPDAPVATPPVALSTSTLPSSTPTTSSAITPGSPSSANTRTSMLTLHTAFFCGVIKGALSNLGVMCSVAADATSLPTCKFTIKTHSL